MKNGLVAVLSVVVFCGLVAVVDIICVKYEIPRFTMFSFIVIGIVVMIFALGSHNQATVNETATDEELDDDFGDEQDLIDGEVEEDFDDEDDFNHDYDDDDLEDDEEETKK